MKKVVPQAQSIRQPQSSHRAELAGLAADSGSNARLRRGTAPFDDQADFV